MTDDVGAPEEPTPELAQAAREVHDSLRAVGLEAERDFYETLADEIRPWSGNPSVAEAVGWLQVLIVSLGDSFAAGEKPQIAEARNLVKGQVVDAVLISLGGNDIGFSDAITTCARFARCPSEYRRGLLGGDVTSKSKTLHSEVQTKLGKVPGRYVKLNRCLTVGGSCNIVGATDEPLRRAANGVFITEYPDLSRNGGGAYCDGVLRPPLPSGVADEEFAWADKVVLRGTPGSTFKLDVNFGQDPTFEVREDGLNRAVAKTDTQLGWNPVSGIYAASKTHGYCAKKHWVVQMDESLYPPGGQVRHPAPQHRRPQKLRQPHHQGPRHQTRHLEDYSPAAARHTQAAVGRRCAACGQRIAPRVDVVAGSAR